jgi:hypothetical protein
MKPIRVLLAGDHRIVKADMLHYALRRGWLEPTSAVA